jgi:hypothetical protein
MLIGYGVEGPSLIPSSARFFYSPQTDSGAHPAQWLLGALFPGGKAAGA